MTEESAPQRRLWVVRHAKSDWSTGLDDIDRPLSKRGRRDSPEIGLWLNERGARIQLALVSTSRRTRQTWSHASDTYAHECPAQFDSNIYDADSAELLDLVRTCPAAVTQVALVGHSPGCQDLVRVLTAGAGDSDAQLAVATKYPTSAVAEIAIATSWEDVGPGSGSLVSFGVPRG